MVMAAITSTLLACTHSCKHQCEFSLGGGFNFAEPSGRHANQGSRNFLFLSFNIDTIVKCYVYVMKEKQ